MCVCWVSDCECLCRGMNVSVGGCALVSCGVLIIGVCFWVFKNGSVLEY